MGPRDSISLPPRLREVHLYVEDRLPRKLAAILYADVAGYSRLSGEDEDATHRRHSPRGSIFGPGVE